MNFDRRLSRFGQRHDNAELTNEGIALKLPITSTSESLSKRTVFLTQSEVEQLIFDATESDCDDKAGVPIHQSLGSVTAVASVKKSGVLILYTVKFDSGASFSVPTSVVRPLPSIFRSSGDSAQADYHAFTIVETEASAC